MMKIWAQRGCSRNYPENTITAFKMAVTLFEQHKEKEQGLTGIELDVQMTKDLQLVVIHDETVDRTTDGYGFVREYTLEELQNLHIYTGEKEPERIPTLNEVLSFLRPYLKEGLMLNIELKSENARYNGIEGMVYDAVKHHDLIGNVSYSSFYAKSLEIMRKADKEADIGILSEKASDCLYKIHGGCGANAIHPCYKGIDIDKSAMEGYPVRVWFIEDQFPIMGSRMNTYYVNNLEKKGVTDVFLNEPEYYLNGC